VDGYKTDLTLEIPDSHRWRGFSRPADLRRLSTIGRNRTAKNGGKTKLHSNNSIAGLSHFLFITFAASIESPISFCK
jgi:hypothetical protein